MRRPVSSSEQRTQIKSQRRMKTLILSLVLSSSFLFLSSLFLSGSPARNSSSSSQQSPPPRSTDRLKTGSFLHRFRDREGHTDLGQTTLTIQRIPNSPNFRFAADISGEFAQQWESIASPAFDPIFAKLSFGEAADSVPAFELHYARGRVSGFVTDRKGPTKGTNRPVDSPVPTDTVDQRIDWAAAAASDLDNAKQFEFKVYDPGTGISLVVGKVGPLERIQVPAGTFDAYRLIYQMEKSSGTEHYQSLVSKDMPRIFLREEFPNGVIGELVSIKPAP
jgi:hypothetical protein